MSAFIAMLALGCGAGNVDGTEARSSFFSRPALLGAHRGGAGWMPENTLRTFQASAERWPDIVLETDVHLSADGVAVLLHDDTLERTTNGTGRPGDMTLTELQALDAGYRFTTDAGATYPCRGQGFRIPTLEEVLDAPPNSRFIIELKDQPGVAEAVAEVIQKTGASHRVVVGSYHSEHANRFAEIAPGVARCFTLEEGLAMLAALREGGWDAYQPAAPVLAADIETFDSLDFTAEEVAAVRGKGIYLQLYVLNTPEKIREVLDRGVDCILTDYPELLETVLRQD
ncbi:MAG: glycerophosphodiester phosphodiesterase [Candidatus Hydrogenedentes bacterium]|nr:glycerophosphodiester phosphodiesterase [Candidatus Hydrogenedentota bacterium]